MGFNAAYYTIRITVEQAIGAVQLPNNVEIRCLSRFVHLYTYQQAKTFVQHQTRVVQNNQNVSLLAPNPQQWLQHVHTDTIQVSKDEDEDGDEDEEDDGGFTAIPQTKEDEEDEKGWATFFQ